MGLVANVDDQVVLTVQAAVNYLTKYIGKLGGGQSAASKMSSYIDEIICKMPDDQEMTVASLLSRLFIHAAVPQEILLLGGVARAAGFAARALVAPSHGAQREGHPVLQRTSPR